LGLSLKSGHRLSVLIVDDEADIRETLKMFLEMMEVFTFIVEASDGSDAFQKVQRQQFDLIITDLMMPKVKGIELIQNIKKHEKKENLTETPIIILSANITGDSVVEALQLGVKTALTKPCKTDDFIDKVEEMLLKFKKNKVQKTS
jgi:YesN/AraC family two-component response regulator